MKELIERLERATEGSRVLDLAIAVAVRGLHPTVGEYDDAKFSTFADEVILYQNAERQGIYDPAAIPRYTASLDAAMTLVPDNWWLAEVSRGRPVFSAAATYDVMLQGRPEKHGIKGARANHKTSLAIALCIASLKARTGGSHG